MRSFLKSKIVVNIFTSTVSFALIFLAVEIYLRINPPVQIYMATRNVVQQTHSEMSPDPILGYIPKAGLVKPFRNLEFNVMVRINSMNMRGREYSLAKPQGEKRIAVIGDSFVFGWGVENEETFSEILESKYLKNTEVLNFGVSGYTAYQEIERLKQEALRFHPDIVLFALYGFPKGYPSAEALRYMMRAETLHYASDEKLSLKQKIVLFLDKNSRFFNLLQFARMAIQIHKENLIDEDGMSSADIQNGLKIITELKNLGEEKHFIPMVVYIPTKEVAKEGNDFGLGLVDKACQKESLPFLDLTPRLRDFWIKQKKSPYFRLDDHWNRDGHKVAAKSTAEFLAEQELPSSTRLEFK